MIKRSLIIRCIWGGILVCIPFMAACNAANKSFPTATPSPSSTNTPSPTFVPTITPTSTPSRTPTPTRTLTPTPVPAGSTVTFDGLQITVMEALYRYTICPGSEPCWEPKPDYVFIDVGVLVRNLRNDGPYQVKWKDVHLSARDMQFPPTWAATKTFPIGTGVDPHFPLYIRLEGLLNEEAVVEFEQDTYLRLVYVVPYYGFTFGIGDSPQSELSIEHTPY